MVLTLYISQRSLCFLFRYIFHTLYNEEWGWLANEMPGKIPLIPNIFLSPVKADETMIKYLGGGSTPRLVFIKVGVGGGIKDNLWTFLVIGTQYQKWKREMAFFVKIYIFYISMLGDNAPSLPPTIGLFSRLPLSDFFPHIFYHSVRSGWNGIGWALVWCC